MGSTENLSGRWLGIYNYPSGAPPVAFTADLTDGGGRLGGTISEQDVLRDGRTLVAMIDGQCDGASVEFTKFYEDADPEGYDAVAYRGNVNADRTEISGKWEIPGVWSGTFIMTRPTGEEIAAETEAEATVD